MVEKSTRHLFGMTYVDICTLDVAVNFVIGEMQINGP